MFIRFVIGADGEDATWLTGIFVHARMLRDDGRLFRHEKELLEDAFAWFNDNLPCPPFEANLGSGAWSPDAVSWFRDDAGEVVRRIWDIVALLREDGVPVRLVRSARPGRIVYSDRFQVVAETRPWG